jgi:hypothetical protein
MSDSPNSKGLRRSRNLLENSRLSIPFHSPGWAGDEKVDDLFQGGLRSADSKKQFKFIPNLLRKTVDEEKTGGLEIGHLSGGQGLTLVVLILFVFVFLFLVQDWQAVAHFKTFPDYLRDEYYWIFIIHNYLGG